MRNNIIKLSLLSSLLFLGYGCGDDFLDDPIKEGTETLSSVQLEEAIAIDPEVTNALMTGVYSLTFQTETGGTGGHDDFGQKAYDIFGDMLSGDMALSQSVYGWYRASITEFQGPSDFTFLDNYQVWRYYYRIIRACNQVIDGLGGMDVIPESDENKYIMGQAKTLRAHSYFYLTQFFQKEYNPSELILPIYRNSTEKNGPKVSAEEIYTLIEGDLKDAITLLEGFNRSNKTEINQDIAHAVYAYVLAAKGEYGDAYTHAAAVVNGGAYTLMQGGELTGGFNNLATSGWMWGVDLNTEIGLGLISWWGQMDYYSYSYPAFGDFKSIDQSLFDAIPADDVRKGQFFNNTSFGEHLMPLFKFYDENRQRYGASQTVQADYVYMRVAEMHLLAAEAAAKSGAEGTAKTMLKNFVATRVPDASYIDALGGQSLLDEIYLQTRIELWGEGKSYLAMKRNKATITRGSNHLSFVGVPIQYNDERLTFEIPESEIQNNPFVSDQNQ
ncbi:RagB/SusD family nutrient uptake outer membrane protein [Tenacibaculum tangerinum]|uniref:RagB/SusD family nutrient uptake outer membrane protein n=1 Tax=Tenacibaculum tangerinum TaxID=3038772 RepID=A0ABY8L2V7_9FLAO|nr:RagB/SusD family nutrient uptake outer membrane protein [Tenacibaculum tangerinum]WGH75421.1 RagB/SusD family nutrient uptake outer membrane protein [Tenacibaculum tangerinum]